MEAILLFFYIFVNLPLLPQLHLQNSKLPLRHWKGGIEGELYCRSSEGIHSKHRKVHLIQKWRQFYCSFIFLLICPCCLSCTCRIQNCLYGIERGELREKCQKDKKMTFATILEKSWEDDRKTSNRPLARAEMPKTAAKRPRLRDTSDTGIGFPERSL